MADAIDDLFRRFGKAFNKADVDRAEAFYRTATPRR